MSRLRRIIHGAASSYFVLVATALFSLTSFPLALHYLTKERFALWALMGTVGQYLNLVDFGMSASVARLLIDHKDQPENASYGGLIKTGWFVLAVQGAILLGAGLILAPLLSRLLDIPGNLRSEFIQLMDWQSLALALGLALRIPSHLLYAHQRIDVISYVQTGTLALNLLLLWLFFHAGQGVLSLAWANLIAVTTGVLFSLALSWRLGLFPPAGAWGHTSWQQFRDLFAFGKDLFLVAVGSQLIMASQILIITRRVGLEAAALWSVGTRAFAMLSQLVWRPADVSAPAISEMIARREHALLRSRYQALLSLTGSLSAVAAVSYALCNNPFVTVWMHGKFYWSVSNDVLLGVWLIVLALLHCHNGFVLLTKEIRFMRFIYFVEGLIFIATAFLVSGIGGLPAVIGCSILCSTLFSCAYGVWRVSRYFNLSVSEVGLGWLAPMARVLALFVPVALIGWFVSDRLAPLLLAGPLVKADPNLACNAVKLALNALLAALAGSYLLLRFGLSGDLQRELLERAPKWIRPGLKPLLSRHSSVAQ